MLPLCGASAIYPQRYLIFHVFSTASLFFSLLCCLSISSLEYYNLVIKSFAESKEKLCEDVIKHATEAIPLDMVVWADPNDRSLDPRALFKAQGLGNAYCKWV